MRAVVEAHLRFCCRRGRIEHANGRTRSRLTFLTVGEPQRETMNTLDASSEHHSPVFSITYRQIRVGRVAQVLVESVPLNEQAL